MNAQIDADYEPINNVVTFESGETEKMVTIMIMAKDEEETAAETKGDDDDEEEAPKKFKVLLTDATPEGIKISKKNSCIVELRKVGKPIDIKEEHKKMI